MDAVATTPMLEVARRLRDEWGFSVIALDHPDAPIATKPDQIGKVPVAAWKLFQDARASDDNLAVWFGNGRPRNLGIVTGAISGVAVVDCDSPEAEEWAEWNLPPTPMMTKTRRGTHRFYRHPGVPVPSKNKIPVEGFTVDLKADGGYVVGPGSTHHTGFVYARVGAWPSVDQLPVFDPAWLPIPDAPAVPDTRPTAPPPSVDRDRKLTRARAYLAKVPGAVQGQGGDDATYIVACRLARDFDLDPADALTVFAEWNRTCLPPWAETDLAAKLSYALKYGTGSIGTKLAEDRPRPQSLDININRCGAAPTEPVTALTDLDLTRLTDAHAAELFAQQASDHLRFDQQQETWFAWQSPV